MKGLSIAARITLLCALLATLVSALALGVYALGDRALQDRYYRGTLEATVQLAVGDISYRRGQLEVDRSLSRLSSARVAVYDLEGDLLYGRELFSAEFEDGAFRTAEGRDGGWHFLDSRLTFEDGADVWLRCSVSTAADSARDGRYWVLLVLLPALVALAGLGGFAIARQALAPVAALTAAAGDIAGGDDLKLRLPLKGPRDELYRLGAVFNDMLARLERAFDRERRFSADAAHELRTPVAAILSQSEYALSEAASEADRRAALEAVRDRAADMRALTEKLMLLARMDSGQVALSRERIDLALLGELVAESLANQAEAAGIALEAVGGEPVWVRGDQTMLLHAAMNLVDNGIKYGLTGGLVRIEAAAGDGLGWVRVTDDGPGMTPEQAAHVRERFYQADPAHRGAGAGLGLPLVDQIAALHGGRLEVESRPGAGSTFALGVPLAEPDSGGEAG